MKIRRRRKRKQGEETAPVINDRVSRRKESGNERTSKRRDFRLERLEKKAEVLKHRKWVFISIAIIVVAAAAVIFKVL